MELKEVWEDFVKVAILLHVTLWTVNMVVGHSNHPSGYYGNADDKAATGFHADKAPSAGFHDSNVVQDKDHIGEHLEESTNLNVSEMSPGELEFHYFKLHDFDNNSMLDGLEIYKALTHLLPYADVEDKPTVDRMGKTHEQIRKDEKDAESLYYTEIVDTVLDEDDLNDDGYLTYTEYLIARHREEYQRNKERNAGRNADRNADSQSRHADSRGRH